MPPETARGPLACRALALFRRREVVQAAQVAPPSEVLGKSEFFECAAAIQTDTGLVEHGARLSVLVIDCSEDICASLSPADTSVPLTAEAFLPEDGGEFYSLDEGEAPEEGGQRAKAAAKQKAKAKAKSMTQAQRKMSAAVLAERLDCLLSTAAWTNWRRDRLAWSTSGGSRGALGRAKL